MSDRRPEKLISGHHLRMAWMEDGEWTSRPATVADVRRGVESGTIKGEVVNWCETHLAQSSSGSVEPARWGSFRWW